MMYRSADSFELNGVKSAKESRGCPASILSIVSVTSLNTVPSSSLLSPTLSPLSLLLSSPSSPPPPLSTRIAS